MASAEFDLLIQGIAVNNDVGWASAVDLHVPIEDLSLDFRSGFLVPLAGKVSTGGEDDSVNLIAYELVGSGGLAAGAFKNIYERGGRHFYLPEPTGTGATWSDNTANPLAWTLLGEKAPIMSGCGHLAVNGNYAIRKMVEFGGDVYGIDSKNHVVVRKNAGVWEHYVGGGTGWTTTHFTGSITNVTNPAGTTHRVFTSATLPAVNDKVQIAGVLGATSANNTTANPVWTVTAINSGAGWFEFDPAIALAGAYVSGGTWKATVEALNGTYPTDIFTDGTNLYVGTDSGIARQTTTGLSYSNFTNFPGTVAAARCFVLVGEFISGDVLWWSDGASLYERVALATPARAFSVGETDSPIEALEWQKDVIIANKRDGCYSINPDTHLITPLVSAHTKPRGNAHALAAHGGRVYFSVARDFYSYDGTTLFEETFYKVEGAGRTPFYSGQVLSCWSDTQKLYVWLKVVYGSKYYYYLCAFTGSTGGWHPILLVTSTIAPDTGRPTDALEPAAIFLDGTKLHYSVASASAGNGRGITGYLHTNGDVPLCSATEPFTSVAINLGWYDLNSPAVSKFLKEIRFSFVDQGTNLNKPKFYYKKRADTSWTEITGTVVGTQDNTTLALQTATGNQLGDTVSNQVAFKVEVQGAQDAAAYLEKLYLIGLPCYTPSQRGSFAAWLYGNTNDPDKVDEPYAFVSPVTIRAGLKAAIKQVAPVKMTLPDGTTAYAKLDGGSDQRIESYDKDQILIVEQKFVVTWREMT